MARWFSLHRFAVRFITGSFLCLLPGAHNTIDLRDWRRLILSIKHHALDFSGISR
ncbi:hypothetical protein [Prosthecobacter sp.]|uniref:hypothetical protein n=1 Tax=Prosthecobacter sp. TaxID=1965333 RepID=UPI0024899BB7|nr:hypothetical protein [Prosthecobacter sp.]MDI1315449.1 hypothetical protein [Prosthecobacter sp.]